MIHPTAVIDPAAQVHPTARVGAYVCIEGPAVVGPACVLEAHAVLTGDVQLGADNRIGHGAIIGGWPQDRAYDPVTASSVRIGDRNIIREHCTIHRGTSPGSATVVGNGCFLMVGSHLGHNTRLGNNVVLANHVLLAGHVEMGDGVFAGGSSVFHQHMRVGRGAMIQGNSSLGMDLPPFTMAAEINRVVGLNVVGMRRGGFSRGERTEIKAAFKLLYGSNLNVTQALEAAAGRTWGPGATEFFAFVAGARKRGVCAFRKRAATAERG